MENQMKWAYPKKSLTSKSSTELWIERIVSLNVNQSNCELGDYGHYQVLSQLDSPKAPPLLAFLILIHTHCPYHPNIFDINKKDWIMNSQVLSK